MEISKAVGQYIRKFRQDGQYALADLASRSHEFGTNWTSATIANMEKGASRADALPNILILLATMNSLEDEKWSVMQAEYSLSDAECAHDRRKLADIFDGVDRINVAQHTPITFPSKCIVKALRGGEVDLKDPENIQKAKISFYEGLLNDTEEMIRIMEECYRKNGEEPPKQAEYATAAEIRAAKKLGVDPLDFATYCLQQYGHSMDEETSKRAGDNATPQKRGRATREIMKEYKAFDDGIRTLMSMAESEAASGSGDPDKLLKKYTEYMDRFTEGSNSGQKADHGEL